MRTFRLLALFVLLAASGVALAADQPQLINAKVETRSAAAGLQETVNTLLRQPGPAWISYSVPVVAGEHEMCCFNRDSDTGSCCSGCSLEPRDSGKFVGSSSGDCKLESASYFFVFLRMDQGRVEKVRTFSADCGIDASGLTVYELTGVHPAESVTLLTALATVAPNGDESRRRIENGAIMAIAFHADPAADKTLDTLVGPSQPSELRKKTAFWLGQLRGKHGLDTLLELMRTDTDDHFRSEVVFPISQSREPNALDALMRIAHDDSSSRVRSQALFWLAQKAGKKILGTLTDAIENDPDTDVKKKAVFALTQMPKDEGIPLLIQVAKNNRNPAVRKQAVFWLGQSHDPRALDFIESVLRQ